MKIIKLVAGLFALALIFNACAATPPVQNAADGPDELDYAIRDISDYLNDNIPTGSRIVILNIDSASVALSDYIIDELIANAVNDRIFEVVDRQRLDLIRQEQNFQMSGEVDDDLALSVGRFFGAQTIVSGRVMPVGNRFRVTIRALDVETARIQGQYNRNLAAGPTINALMAAGGASPQAATSAVAPGSRQPTVAGTTPTAQVAPVAAEPPITGTMVPGNNLAEMVAWLQRSAQSHGTYIVELRASETIPPSTDLHFPGAINITIALRGDGENRTLRLSSHGTMFTIRENVTAILDNNITLQGHAGNTAPLVVINGGTGRMRTGSTITGNINTRSGGGGVHVQSGALEMTGGSISNNIASSGGGVLVRGAFTMSGGNIIGNTSSGTGMGFPVHGGGGVSVENGATFIIRGGMISGNTAHAHGGGVFVIGQGPRNTTFTKNGGTITGYNSDPNSGNVVKDNAGNVISRRGHAVHFFFITPDSVRRRETTAGPGVNLSVSNRRASGAWEN